MTKTRKQYSKEFKLVTISLVLDQGFTRKEAAASLEINAQMLGRWIKESKDEDGQAFRGNEKLTPDQEKRSEIFVYHPAQECLANYSAMQGLGCQSKWLLSVSQGVGKTHRP